MFHSSDPSDSARTRWKGLAVTKFHPLVTPLLKRHLAGKPVLPEVRAFVADLNEALYRHDGEPGGPAATDAAGDIRQAALEASKDCLIVVDGEGGILAHNRRFVDLWNLPESLMAAGHFDRLLPNISFELRDPGDLESVLQAVAADTDAAITVVLPFADGRYFELHTERLRHPTGVARLWAFRDVSTLKQSEAEFRHDAFHDALTGLPNRALFIDRVGQALARAKRSSQLLAVMFLDLDRFKHVNDTLGHGAGDELLKAVAERLQARVRAQDTVARLAGDEFMMLVSDLGSPEDVSHVAGSILDALRLPVRMGDHAVHVGGSIGIAIFPDHGGDRETLMKRADIALYRAKEDGRNRYQFFEEGMTNTNEGKVVFENELRRAIEDGQLVVHYQPVFDLRRRRVVGVEALVRWRRSDGSLVLPGHFIAQAEQAGLIGRISEWALRRVGRERLTWPAWMRERLDISINLSSQQFWDPHLVQKISQELEGADLPPERIILELTESVVMKDPPQSVAMLRALAKRGIRVALDDFGTGHSSLGALRTLPISILKIDKSFILHCHRDDKDLAIVRSVIQMAQSLEIPVVSEGVESREQAQILARQGGRFIQGFWVSRPIAGEALVDLLVRKQAGQEAAGGSTPLRTPATS
ncbi:MAG: EAL domain-containing protein [Gemmatimonadota bacterium]